MIWIRIRNTDRKADPQGQGCQEIKLEPSSESELTRPVAALAPVKKRLRLRNPAQGSVAEPYHFDTDPDPGSIFQ